MDLNTKVAQATTTFEMTTNAIRIGLVSALLLMQTSFVRQNPTADTAQKMAMGERLAKARAAKAEKKATKSMSGPGNIANTDRATGLKALPADYKAPVDKTQKGPNGELVHTGERGGKYYINKNGNKTYLSSNQ